MNPIQTNFLLQGDALLLAKSLLRGRGPGGGFSHFATTWTLLRRTAWATRPTR